MATVSAGGGSVTFGAPMVVYSQQAAQLYKRLQKMEAHAEKDAGARHPPLQFHNFVNGPPLKVLTLRLQCRSVSTEDCSICALLLDALI